ncbi:MAG: hypothetical protein ABWZ08_06920 [Pseudoxanthomonas sp.]
MKIMGYDYSRRKTQHRRYHDIGVMTDEIASHIPRMWKRSTSEQDFWFWFCGEMDSVERNASDTAERSRMRARLQAALARAGVPRPPLRCSGAADV